MSRYTFLGREPGISIVAGWDPPLHTFFAQVHDARLSGDANPTIWVGATPNELGDVAELRQAIESHGELPALIALCLADDQEADR